MSVGQLRLDTYTDLATAIAQTWHGGPSATVWEDVLASNDVDLRIGELAYRRLRDSIDSRSLFPATFVATYAELLAITQSERAPDAGPCPRCQGAPGWREITDRLDHRFHGPACTWLADRQHDRPHPAECACRPVVVPCSCPLGERAKKQHAAIERRRAARSAWTDSTTPPRDWTEIGSPDDADYSAAPLPLEPPADDGAFYDQEQF